MSEDVCAIVARETLQLANRPLPAAVEREAKRSLYNVLGLAIGAAAHDGVNAILATARDLAAPQTVALLGRSERTDPHFAALVTGFAAHVDEFDDTHLATVIHPGAATLGALVALCEQTHATFQGALTAFALGCEVQLRLGVAISPEHYERGWHITGTCGVAGAATAAALLLGHDEVLLARALRLAAQMSLGHREAFGTMAKAFHPAKAAANGILAALRAPHVDAPAGMWESGHGFAAALFSRFDSAQVTGAFGERWELASNTYKPYPCGIVAHPAIDAAIALAHDIAQTGAIASVLIDCHPLVPELMGNPDPRDGLQARFSAIHGVAAALCDREVGLAQYETQRVAREDVRSLRSKTRLRPSNRIARDEARIEIALANGATLSHHVEHARGSLARPLTDRELFEKFRRLVDVRLGEGTAQRLTDAFRALDPGTPFTMFLDQCANAKHVSHA